MIDLNKLGDPSRIEHDEIRRAAEHHAAAQQGLKAARRDLARLDGSIRIARVKDAEAEAEARFVGKPAPKRSHEGEATKKLADAEHEVAVAEALVRRTRKVLQDAVEEHGAEWAADLATESAAVDQAYEAALRAALDLHHQRVHAHARLRMAGTPSPINNMLRLTPRDLVDSITGARVELARNDDPGLRWRQRVLVPVDVVLDGLAKIDEPEEERPFMPGGGLATAIREAAEHAQAVERGFSLEEGQSDAPIRVTDGQYNVAGIPVHLPTGGQVDPWGES